MSKIASKMNARRAMLRGTALATAACAALWGHPVAAAQSQTYSFDIPEQSLAVALRSYAQASGQQIIFSEDIVAGRHAAALQGQYTPEDALQHLLKDTGLVVERAPSGAAMIKRPQQSGQNARGGWREIRANKISTDVGGNLVPAGVQVAQAGASPQAAPASAPDTRVAGLEEVVVTARRREESLQRVPIAVQAFTEAQLSERRIETNTDLTKLVPSLSTSLADRSDEQFTLRGQTGYGASFSGQQVAAPIYLSEVPLPIGDGAGPGRYFDLQNIQVLKGPQGTLFGRNSTGGAVLLVPRKPTEDLSGYIQGEYGNYNDRALEAAINLPLMTDKVLLRAAGKVEHRDGFTQNPTTHQDLDDRDYVTGRFSMLLKPADTLENLTVMDIYHSNTNGTSNHITNYDPNNFVVQILGGTVQAAAAQKLAAGPRKTFTTVLGRNNIDSLGISNTTTWNVSPDLTFKNIFGYRRFEQLLSYDYDGSPLNLINFDTCTSPGTCNTSSPDNPQLVNVEQISEEPQLQGTLFDKRLTYTVGAFYLHVRSPGSNYQHLTTIFGITQDTNLRFNDESLAGYGQATYDLSEWLPGLKLTGGYRYTHDDRNLSVSQVGSGACTTGTPGAAAPNPANAPQCLGTFNVKQNTSSYTVGADYQVNADVMVYITHRRGFRAGGVNPFAGALGLASPPLPFATALFTYKPEIVTDVEGGAKADWRFNDMSLRTNLSIFHSHLKNAQIYQTIPVGGFTPFALTNAASADINGGELEAVFAPVESFELRGAYAYTDASFGPYLDYVNRTPANQPTTATGRAFPFAPKHKFDISARYQLPIDESYGKLSATFSWSHKSTVLLALVPFTQAGVRDPAAYQKATNNLDLSVNWTDLAKTGFDARFYVSNLANTTYVVGGAALINSLGTDQAVYNEPRMFGIQIRKTFGTGG